MPIRTAWYLQSARRCTIVFADSQTFSLAPATELLIEVEGCGAVAHLDVGQPLGDDVQERSIEANGNPNDGDHNPSLRILICSPDLLSPANLAGIVEASGLFPAGLAS